MWNSPHLSLPLTGNMNFTKNRSLGWVYSFRSQKMIGLTSFTFDSHMLCNICIKQVFGAGLTVTCHAFFINNMSVGWVGSLPLTKKVRFISFKFDSHSSCNLKKKNRCVGWMGSHQSQKRILFILFMFGSHASCNISK